MKWLLRSQLSRLNVLCADDHILNSFHFDLSTGSSSERDSHASAKIMATVANVRLQGIWNENWSRNLRNQKRNNEKLSLSMVDCVFLKNNNIKCKRKTT